MGTPPAGIPEADGLATSDASAVATNAVASRAIPGRGGSRCRCGSLLEGEDPDPLRHQVIEHRFSSLVDLLGSAYPLSFNKTQALLNQLLEVEISRGEIATIRQRISAVLTTRWPTSNSPTGQRGWQWLMVSRVNRVHGFGFVPCFGLERKPGLDPDHVSRVEYQPVHRRHGHGTTGESARFPLPMTARPVFLGCHRGAKVFTSSTTP
jgi:hypothetical protein